MALSDPVNVRLGAARRQKMLMKLAQQMAARAGGRAQGAGAFFRSNVQGRRTPSPSIRLPFPMPVNRARPVGFDPNPGMPPVFESGPPSMGGGMGLSEPSPVMASTTSEPITYDMLGATPSPITGPEQPGMISGPTLTQSDLPLGVAMPSFMNPDPWSIFAPQMPKYRGGAGSYTTYAV